MMGCSKGSKNNSKHHEAGGKQKGAGKPTTKKGAGRPTTKKDALTQQRLQQSTLRNAFHEPTNAAEDELLAKAAPLPCSSVKRWSKRQQRQSKWWLLSSRKKLLLSGMKSNARECSRNCKKQLLMARLTPCWSAFLEAMTISMRSKGRFLLMVVNVVTLVS
jgi:hypothetical protein